jgi:hypothetical protein
VILASPRPDGPADPIIRRQVEQRAGVSVELRRLRAWLGRCKITTAERIAREIIRMDRYLTSKGA